MKSSDWNLLKQVGDTPGENHTCLQSSNATKVATRFFGVQGKLWNADWKEIIEKGGNEEAEKMEKHWARKLLIKAAAGFPLMTPRDFENLQLNK